MREIAGKIQRRRVEKNINATVTENKYVKELNNAKRGSRKVSKSWP